MIDLLDVSHFDTVRPSLQPAVDRLEGGGLLVYPTETVYGIGCLVRAEPLARLAAAKSRETSSPMLLLVSGREAVNELSWSPEAEALAEVFWPGAVTLILPDPRERFPDGIRGPSGGVGVRVSPHPIVREIMASVAQPLVSTSVNARGKPSARSGDEALGALRELKLTDHLTVLDAGELPVSEASTVIDCTGPRAVVVREGAVPVGRLRCILPDLEVLQGSRA